MGGFEAMIAVAVAVMGKEDVTTKFFRCNCRVAFD